MEKIWYIKIDGKEQGPFSVEELNDHKEITSRTLVRKEGYLVWIPLHLIPELRHILKDRDEEPEIMEDVKKEEAEEGSDALVLELQQAPPPLIFWLFLAIAVLVLLLALMHLT